jgi:hypothetical protein
LRLSIDHEQADRDDERDQGEHGWKQFEEQHDVLLADYGRQTVTAASPRAGHDELGTIGDACARHEPALKSLKNPLSESGFFPLRASLLALFGGAVSNRMLEPSIENIDCAATPAVTHVTTAIAISTAITTRRIRAPPRATHCELRAASRAGAPGAPTRQTHESGP